MMSILRTFCRDEEGQDMIEYCLLLGFVAMAAAAICITLGNDITTLWNAIASKLAATD